MVRKIWIVLFVLILSIGLIACRGGAEESAESESAESAPPAMPTATEPEVETENIDRTDSAIRTFIVVPEESKALYIVQEEFLAGALTKLGINAGNYEVTGTTPLVEGQLLLDLEAATLGDKSHILVDMTGLTTGESRRDEWIQENGPTFSTYPTAAFVPTAVENVPQSYSDGEEVTFHLLGDLTVRDVTQPVTFDVTATLNGDTIRGTATSHLRMSDFGIEPPSFANTLTVADEFTVQIELTAQELRGDP